VRASGGAISAAALAGAWDRCAGALAARLSAALASASPAAASAPQLLALAEYVRLLGAALRGAGLWTAALEAALHEAQEKWAAEARAEALAELRQALAAPGADRPLRLDSAAAYEREVVRCGLHPAEAPLPRRRDFPLLAPFTPVVPCLLRALDAHAADVVLFCGSVGEEGLLAAARLRDTLLAACLDGEHLGGALAAAAAAARGRAGQGGVEPLVQAAADAAALDCAAEELDARLARRCRVALARAAHAELAAMEAGGAAPPRLLRAHREACEEALLAGLGHGVDAFFARAPLEEWAPAEARLAPRQAAAAAAAYLAHTLGEAAQLLAPPTLARLARAAAGRTADACVAPLLRGGEGGGGRRFNVHALAGLHADVAALAAALAPLAVPGLEDAFAEPRQLCGLFLPAGEALERLAGPACEQPAAFRAALQRDFYALAPARLAQLLDRYRELPGPGLLHRAQPGAPAAPKRRAVAVVEARVLALLKPSK